MVTKSRVVSIDYSNNMCNNLIAHCMTKYRYKLDITEFILAIVAFIKRISDP